MAGIYRHLPFCRRKCGYCAFHSRPLPDAATLADYLAALEEELELRRPLLAEARVDTLYFGGGTPSLVAPERIAALIDRCRANVREFADDGEITLEANPETLDADKLAGYRAVGVNRLSLGAQTFDEDALAFLERGHRPEQVRAAVDMARAAGIMNINVDVIVGLPEPHAACWENDLRQALALNPQHLSVYLLSVEQGTRLHEQARTGTFTPLDDERQADIFLDVHEFLTSAGFAHYEVSNYARPGCASRHNSATWRGEAYLGVGAGAHSFWPQEGRDTRWANLAEPGDYRQRLRWGEEPVEFMEEITPPMRRRERLMLALRTAAGVDPREFAPHVSALTAALETMRARDYFTYENDRYRPTPAGMLLADGLAVELWEILE